MPLRVHHCLGLFFLDLCHVQVRTFRGAYVWEDLSGFVHPVVTFSVSIQVRIGVVNEFPRGRFLFSQVMLVPFEMLIQ